MNTIQQVGRASYQLGPENCKDSLHAKILRKPVPKNCNKFGLQSVLKLQHFSLFMSGAWSLWRWPFVANPNFSSLNIDISWPKFLALTPNPWQTSASKSTKRRISGTSSPKSWRVVCFWLYLAVREHVIGNYFDCVNNALQILSLPSTLLFVELDCDAPHNSSTMNRDDLPFSIHSVFGRSLELLCLFLLFFRPCVTWVKDNKGMEDHGSHSKFRTLRWDVRDVRRTNVPESELNFMSKVEQEH